MAKKKSGSGVSYAPGPLGKPSTTAPVGLNGRTLGTAAHPSTQLISPSVSAPAPAAPAPTSKVTGVAGRSLAAPTTYSAVTSGGGSAVPAATAAAAPAADPNAGESDEDYLAGDSTYQAALAALKKTMAGYQTQYNTSKTNYDTDYDTSLKNLGWLQGTNSWNQDDNNTAYGRSYSNQQNDFAARDMLNSSFYGTALNDLLRQFTDQKSDLDTSKSKYETDLANTLAQQQNENDISTQQARAEAIARKAAGVTSY